MVLAFNPSEFPGPPLTDWGLRASLGYYAPSQQNTGPIITLANGGTGISSLLHPDAALRVSWALTLTTRDSPWPWTTALGEGPGDVAKLFITVKTVDEGPAYLVTQEAHYGYNTGYRSGQSVSGEKVFTGLPAEREFVAIISATSTWTRGTAPRPGGEQVAGAAFETKFFSNRSPSAPTLTAPANGITLPYDAVSTDSQTPITWTVNDPDSGYPVSNWDDGGAEIQYRPAPVPGQPEPSWVSARQTASTGWQGNGSTLIPPSTYFASGAVRGGAAPTIGPAAGRVTVPGPGSYQFRVRTRDRRIKMTSALSGLTSANGTNQSEWSPWSQITTVTWTAPFLPPVPMSPINDTAQAGDVVDFRWQFRDPRSTGGSQANREVRIRQVGDATWTEVIPLASQSGAVQTYSWAPAVPLVEGKRYEWQARTTSTPGNHLSTWSESAYFWVVPPPGSGTVVPQPDVTIPEDGLGVGNNRAFIYDRGGLVYRGELRNTSLVRWHRKRDDMSSATVRIDGWTPEDIAFLRKVHTWANEIVIYRDVAGQPTRRVWEGPITRITYGPDFIEFEAHDVAAYIYRRILRQGWNDAYRKDGGGLLPVTVRAGLIVQNALAYDDPNVLPYLQLRIASDDARQSKVVKDFSSTAFEALDSLAASAGLDYTAAGRSIIIWDTHNSIGQLPELRNGDFDNDIVITEYGMRLANVYAITNNNGVYGVAERPKDVYGHIEMLDSAYGETDEAGIEEVLTEEARLKLVATLTNQAERSIAARYPAPLIARVPDNSRMMPHVPIGINQLIPGVFIPLNSDHPVRPLEQMQKLDSMVVEQKDGEESIRVTLSPAPRDAVEDPDAEMEV